MQPPFFEILYDLLVRKSTKQEVIVEGTIACSRINLKELVRRLRMSAVQHSVCTIIFVQELFGEWIALMSVSKLGYPNTVHTASPTLETPTAVIESPKAMIFAALSWPYTCFLGVLDYFHFVFGLILPSSLLKWAIPQEDHFAFHHPDRTHFEGYYTRIQTDDDSTLVFIMSSVHGTNGWGSKSHYLHFSFTPSNLSTMKPIAINRYPDRIDYSPYGSPLSDGRQAFRLTADSYALFSVGHKDQYYWFSLSDPEHEGETLIISARMSSRTPLKVNDLLYTPHHPFVRLGTLIPVHWHIFSTQSVASFMITRRRYLPRPDGTAMREEMPVIQGTGLAHMEKNWGKGFPTSWTWFVTLNSIFKGLCALFIFLDYVLFCRMQGHSPSPSSNHSPLTPRATLAAAGGTISVPGMRSYLVVYRSPESSLNWNFISPMISLPNKRCHTALGLFGYEKIDCSTASVMLDVSSLTKRLIIRAKSEEVNTCLYSPFLHSKWSTVYSIFNLFCICPPYFFSTIGYQTLDCSGLPFISWPWECRCSRIFQRKYRDRSIRATTMACSDPMGMVTC